MQTYQKMFKDITATLDVCFDTSSTSKWKGEEHYSEGVSIMKSQNKNNNNSNPFKIILRRKNI